jgi:hypothetical protein
MSVLSKAPGLNGGKNALPESPVSFSSSSLQSRSIRFAAFAAGAIVAIVGLTILIGWWFQIDAFKRILPGAAPIKPNAGAGFFLCGAALTFLRFRKAPGVDAVVTSLGLVVMVLGLATIVEFFLDADFGFDRWLVYSQPSAVARSAWRTHPVTALTFLLMGAALVLRTKLISLPGRSPLIAGLSSAVVLIGLLPLVGWLLEIVAGPHWNFLGMSKSGLVAALSFMFLGGGSLALLQNEQRLNWSLGRWTTVAFALSIVLTAITIAGAFNFARRMLETQGWVNHRQAVLQKVQECLTNASELASNERVYVLTGDERLVRDRAQQSAALQKQIADLRQLTTDNPSQTSNLDQLGPLVTQNLNWQDQVVAVRREQGPSAATAMIATGRGIELSALILKLFQQMQAEEYRLLVKDRQAVETAAVETFSLLPIGVFISVSVLSVSVFFLNSGVWKQTQSERALRESLKEVSDLKTSLDEHAIVAITDPQGKITYVNDKFCDISKYSRAELLGQDHRIINSAHHPKTFIRDLWNTIGHGQVWHGEIKNRSKDGSYYWVDTTIVPFLDEKGKPRQYVAIRADITERKHAEEQLKASLKEVRDLTAALDEHAIVAITNPQGKITYVNDKFCAISKYSRKELLGQDHQIINSGYHPKEFIRDLWTNIGRGQVWHGEIKNRAKDGSFYWVDTTIVPFLDENGKPRQYVAIRADITERKKIEGDVRKLNVELEQRVTQRTAELQAANKELEAFSYSVSHDLRAPLRAVDGFSQALIEDFGPQLPEEGRHYLRTIRGGAQRMGNLIDDLLTFSRLSRLPLNKQRVNTTRVVRESLRELGAEDSERKVELRVGKLPSCEGDPALLKQVWLNLLSNALKYTRKCEAPRIEVGSKAENGETVYFVADNGTGFDMQYAGKLFGVFQRLHRVDEFEGTGVGLAIVHRVIHRHGGRVWAEAEIDRGATFYFSLGNGANT